MSIRNFTARLIAMFGVLIGTVAVQAEDISYVSTTDASFASRVEALEAELASLRSAGMGGGDGSCASDCDCRSSGVFAGAELLLLTPYNGSLSVSAGPPGSPVVEVTPDFDLAAAPRFWLGYRNSEGLGLRARYFTLDAEGGPSPTLGIVRGLDVRTFDLEVTQIEQLGNWTLDLSAGIRWAQNRNDMFSLAAPVLLTQDFEGWGPTVALGALRPIGSGNFSLFANVRGSLLFGDNDYQIALNVPPLVPVATLQSSNEVVTVGELQLGVEWARFLDNGARVYARAGVEAQAWNIPSPALGLLDDTTGLIGATMSIGLDRKSVV